MNRVLSSAVVVAGFVFTLGGAASWGQVPNTNDKSDTHGNTGGGTGALKNPSLSGTNNSAYGNDALEDNTSGSFNTASGADALQLNTTGGQNTAYGADALEDNATGSFNTASGVNALVDNTTGSFNTASGVEALEDNTSGSFNTASGVNALEDNTTGAYNTALGYQALIHSAGSRNLALGFNAGYNLSSGGSNIYLGNTGLATESYTMRLRQPSAQTRTFIAGIAGVAVSGSQVLINSQGQLGVPLSSSRYKRDIAAMGERSQGLYQLRPVTFRYKQDSQGQRQYGLVAEEVVKVYPELVTKGADGKVEAVQYHELIPMLLNEVQHQQQEIAELKAQAQQVADLKARLERLEAGAGHAAVATQ